MYKVSVITASLNSEKTICQTIESVNCQSYSNKEHIIIDGKSSDRTVELIKSKIDKVSVFLSEKDKGMYDAINKGIRVATGDIIGVLNSDDFFCDGNVLKKLMDVFNNDDVDAVYGDVAYIDRKDPDKIVRYYSSKSFHPGKFRYGFQPAHPSFYVKRSILEQYGLYKSEYKIAGDFELLVRLIYASGIKTRYLSFPFVFMRMGGLSNKSLKNVILMNREDLQACRENGINTNILNIYLKYPIKVFEFLLWKK